MILSALPTWSFSKNSEVTNKPTLTPGRVALDAIPPIVGMEIHTMPYSAKAVQKLRDAGLIKIEPYDQTAFKGASYTLHTNTEIVLGPGEWKTVETQEVLTLGENVCGFLSTRSSVAQMGIDALLTDSFIEPNFSGRLILAMVNHSKETQTIPVGARMVKIIFFPSKDI